MPGTVPWATAKLTRSRALPASSPPPPPVRGDLLPGRTKLGWALDPKGKLAMKDLPITARVGSTRPKECLSVSCPVQPGGELSPALPAGGSHLARGKNKQQHKHRKTNQPTRTHSGYL